MSKEISVARLENWFQESNGFANSHPFEDEEKDILLSIKNVFKNYPKCVDKHLWSIKHRIHNTRYHTKGLLDYEHKKSQAAS